MLRKSILLKVFITSIYFLNEKSQLSFDLTDKSGSQWRDALFPALHQTIAPSKAWLAFGLPTEEFVYWIRRYKIFLLIYSSSINLYVFPREHIGESGCKQLFSHVQSNKFIIVIFLIWVN